jgi:subfamily B ATP-binding cassette protein MsbA
LNDANDTVSGNATDRSGSSTRALVARLWRDWMRPHLGRLTIAAALMIVVAATSAAYPKLIELSVDMLGKGDGSVLWQLPLAIIAVTVIKGSASYGQSVVSQSIALSIINAMQKAMFAHLMRADIAAFHATATGKLISRFTNDVNLMRDALSKSMTGMVRDALTAAALIGVMFYLDWLLALIVVVLFPLAGRPIIRIGRRLRLTSTTTQAEFGEMTSALDQAFSGIRLVKSYRMEAYETARSNALFDRVYDLVMKIVRARSRSYPIVESLAGVTIAAIVAYGGWRIISGTGTLGGFVGFLSAVMMVYQPIRSLGALNASLQEGLAAVNRTFDLLDTPAQIVNRPGATALSVSRGDVALDHVRFAYADGATALDDVSFGIPAGTTAALVGPSGAGKSTVINLLLRFYEPGSGRILIDGQDIGSVKLASLRDAIALVSQDVTLFNDTVAANIGFGRPGASHDEIVAAARNAAADDFIRDLPHGYDTIVGERGVKLSGGQRQRIAIARAMLKDAPILLLDEATSALDAESELLVQQALGRLTEGRTTLVIAHRLATVMGADRIYVLDGGRLVEEGSHDELRAGTGLYARLSTLQFADNAAAE